jgi:hypothetical protein
MKKTLLSVVIFYPLLSFAQRNTVVPQGYSVNRVIPHSTPAQPELPRLSGNTLYTTKGYKIYKGQLLHLIHGTAPNGNFMFLKIGTGFGSQLLDSSTLIVEKLYDLRKSTIDNKYVMLTGHITFKNGATAELTVTLAFDKAIDGRPELGLPSEIKLPAEVTK